MNMTARVIAKIACWSKNLMDGDDLQFYLTWLKEQLKMPVSKHTGVFTFRHIRGILKCQPIIIVTKVILSSNCRIMSIYKALPDVFR